MNPSDHATTDPTIIRRTETTVEISRPVADVAPMDWPRGQFQPTRIGVTYRHRHDERGWCASGTVSGIRIRKDGTLGAEDARTFVGEFGYGKDPEWVTEFIAAHRPAEVFDLRHPLAAEHGDSVATGIHLLPVFAYPDGAFPSHIELTSTGELITGTTVSGQLNYATLTAQPASAAGGWPVTHTVDSALKATAQLLSYAHNYQARMTGSRIPDTAEVELVAPDIRNARGSRWELGMAGMNLRYATPATAFLDMPAVRSIRVLTDVTAERWAGAPLALVVEMDQAQVVAEQAVCADRADLTLTTELRAWLDARAGDLTVEQTDLAHQLGDLLTAWDRAQARERAAIAAGLPRRMMTGSRPAPSRAQQGP